ncbi:MAG: hypothetical protein WB697_05100 [Stellaceae bacterium]
MAAIENIIAWAKHEQARLTQQLAELQAGRLRTYEKHSQPPGWLEVDTTEHTAELCRHYLSELSAIVALHPAVVPTEPAAPPLAPRFVPPQPAVPATEHPNRAETPPRRQEAIHADWFVGWGVVKGQPPRWTFAGIYSTHAEANDAAAKAGEGYYARWGSYNEGSKEFTSGPQFARPDAL